MNPTRPPVKIPFAAFLLAALPLFEGCSDRQAETPTRGQARIAVCEEILPLILEEEARFEELYPEAIVNLRPMSAREAIAELFNDSVKVIVSARELNAEERSAAKALNLEVNEVKIALDAVAVIVNEANGVTKLTLPQLDSIFTGKLMDWGLAGWTGSAGLPGLGRAPGKISLTLPDRNTATYAVFAERVLQGRPYGPPATVASSSEEVISGVEKDPSSIGIVGLNWLRNTKARVRIIELSDPSAPDSLDIRGKYFSPHQAYIYKHFYPITRIIYMYFTPDSYGVSSGFTSFITSAAGQKIVQNQGLVPATMPIRLVELRNDHL